MAPKGHCAAKKKAKKKSRGEQLKKAEAAFDAWHERHMAETARLLSSPLPSRIAPGWNAAGPNCAASKVELHCHSHFSDGSLSPAEVVARAARRGVRALALTDHDTLAGVAEARLAGAACGVAIIPGVEISTYLVLQEVEAMDARDPAGNHPRNHSFESSPGQRRSVGVHLLAYFGAGGPAPGSALADCLECIRTGRIQRIHSIVAHLQHRGLNISAEEVLEGVGPSQSPSRNHVAQVLIGKGIVSSYREAFLHYIGDKATPVGSGAEVEIGHAISLVQAARGVPVLAHPWSVPSLSAGVLLSRLQDLGVRGVEVWRSSTKMQEYDAAALDLGLLRLGGSDYHARGDKGEAQLGACPVGLAEANKLLASLHLGVEPQ